MVVGGADKFAKVSRNRCWDCICKLLLISVPVFNTLLHFILTRHGKQLLRAEVGLEVDRQHRVSRDLRYLFRLRRLQDVIHRLAFLQVDANNSELIDLWRDTLVTVQRSRYRLSTPRAFQSFRRLRLVAVRLLTLGVYVHLIQK